MRPWGSLLLLLGASPLLAAEPPPAALAPAWFDAMRALEPLDYVAPKVNTAPHIDGQLNDEAWRAAPWTSDFVDIQGERRPAPRFRTRAKLVWTETGLYIGAELEEPHLFATLTERDSVIFQDPDFEVFIDPDGDTHQYSEFEINALNTVWDLRLPKPYLDQGSADNSWTLTGLQHAVHFDGTLNRSTDLDRGWTVELFFPWTAFAPLRPQGGEPPRPGEIWRLNFSRVQWHLISTPDGYRKRPQTPEDNWVWSPQGVIDMHRPEMWGRIHFADNADALPPVAPYAARMRQVAFDLYYLQRDFQAREGRWATWQELTSLPALPSWLKVELKPTDTGYAATLLPDPTTRLAPATLHADRLWNATP